MSAASASAKSRGESGPGSSDMPPRDKGFRRRGQRTHGGGSGEWLRTRETDCPEMALDVDTPSNSVGWWASLHDDFTTICESQAGHDRQVGNLKQPLGRLRSQPSLAPRR